MSVSPARAAAFDILLRIERERAFSSVLLPQYEERLPDVDRGLCHELVLGSLRSQIKLDRVLEILSSARKLDPEVRVVLRLGLYQLLFLTRVPPHAAINESVELVKHARKRSAAGFVNAILRRGAGETPKVDSEDELARLALNTSHPRWLIDRWVARLGYEEAATLAAANNEAARISFRILSGRSAEVDELIREAEPSADVEGCYVVERSSAQLRKLAAENKIYMQDEASQLVARIVEMPKGGRFLDVCAAPGGKTGLVASIAHPSLAAAGDLYPARVELLRENCLRQGVDVDVVRYDAAASLPFEERTFDAVLVDAPCTGTGTIRHNPEIRYFLTPGDFEELSSKQRRILRQASKAVKKGGSLVYSTCSLEPEEGEQVAESFLAEEPAFETRRLNVPERFVTEAGFARTWPHRDGMDGFFIAAFRRV